MVVTWIRAPRKVDPDTVACLIHAKVEQKKKSLQMVTNSRGTKVLTEPYMTRREERKADVDLAHGLGNGCGANIRYR